MAARPDGSQIDVRSKKSCIGARWEARRRVYLKYTHLEVPRSLIEREEDRSAELK
jgi:hypothetical protein